MNSQHQTSVLHKSHHSSPLFSFHICPHKLDAFTKLNETVSLLILRAMHIEIIGWYISYFGRHIPTFGSNLLPPFQGNSPQQVTAAHPNDHNLAVSFYTMCYHNGQTQLTKHLSYIMSIDFNSISFKLKMFPPSDLVFLTYNP